VLSPTRRPSRSPRTTAALAVALTALALGTAAWLFVRYPGVLVSGVANTDPKGHVDFETFWRSTVAMLHGADIYRTGSVLPNLNPPFLSLLLAPFGLVDVLPSYWAFTALTVLLVTASVLLTARELRLGRGATVFGVATMWACSPLHGTLLLGQIYGLLLFGLALAWLAQRRGRGRLAAALLGVVVALKPSLAPLLLIPLAQWRAPGRRAALWTGLGSAAGASLAGVLAAGPSSALEWLRLATHTPAPEVDANASLPGLVVRLGLPGWLGWLVTVAVVVVSLWWVRRAVPAPGGLAAGGVERADATIFAVAAGCLLASPIAWLNYTVMLWPGALVLLRAGRWRLGVPLLVFPVIPVAWGNLWQAAPSAPVSLAGRSLYCAVLLGFWLALLAFARSYSASPAAPGSATAAGSVPAGATAVDGTAGDGATTSDGAALDGAALDGAAFDGATAFEAGAVGATGSGRTADGSA
jgi:alpha-1,2-mannosyltransferase